MKAIFGILTALLLTPALASAQDTASQPAAPSGQQAWAQGADAIEADFQLTKDGHIVCFDSAVLKSLKERDPKWRTAWLCSFEKRANGKPRDPANPGVGPFAGLKPGRHEIKVWPKQ